MPLSNAAKARLKREVMLLQKDPPPGIQAQPKDEGENLQHWTATIEGPRDSPFAGVSFTVQMEIPPRYPLEPPSCQFVGSVMPFHPNIDGQGRICLDTLKRPPSGTWSPAVSLTSLLLSLQLLLGEPNADDGLMPEISKLYQSSREAWHQEAKRKLLELQEQQQTMISNSSNSRDTAPTSEVLAGHKREKNNLDMEKTPSSKRQKSSY